MPARRQRQRPVEEDQRQQQHAHAVGQRRDVLLRHQRQQLRDEEEEETSFRLPRDDEDILDRRQVHGGNDGRVALQRLHLEFPHHPT